MLKRQKFKSLAGVQKRCAFENAHPIRPHWRFGLPSEGMTPAQFDKACHDGLIWWQLERLTNGKL